MGSFDVGAYVYFFFRETAIEYINCGKAVYSRVARVCKKDIGGKTILVQNFATYLKARLNCSISGEFPFYFNEIQSVYQLPTDKTKFYATFTTSTNGLVGSAVCSYDLNDIQEAFAGEWEIWDAFMRMVGNITSWNLPLWYLQVNSKNRRHRTLPGFLCSTQRCRNSVLASA